MAGKSTTCRASAGDSAARLAGLVNWRRIIHIADGVADPITTVAVEFDVMMHEVAFTPQTDAEQFCESGSRLTAVMYTVELGYAAAGVMLMMRGGAITCSAA
jgi:hypothetical protein